MRKVPEMFGVAGCSLPKFSGCFDDVNRCSKCLSQVWADARAVDKATAVVNQVLNNRIAGSNPSTLRTQGLSLLYEY